MIYDMYFLSPASIKYEIEHVFQDDRFRGIKPVFFTPTANVERNSESIIKLITEINCDNDVFVLFEGLYPPPVITDDLSSRVNVHMVEYLCGMFIGSRSLQEHLDACDFLVLPGWLDKWQENILDFKMNGLDPKVYFTQMYSSIFVADTGFYPDIHKKISEFSKFTGLPYNVVPVDIEYFMISTENNILQWDAGKKQAHLKAANKKTASYAMSLDFIRKMADVSTESSAIESICKLFEMMFAPKKVIFYSLPEESANDYSHLSSEDMKLMYSFMRSDASYISFNSDDSFAIKISSNDELLGMVEVCNIFFPENIDEYISISMDIAKASALTLSNIRRYEELSKSRKKYSELADMLRTTNHILRHDIANSLHIVTSALDMYENSDDVQFVNMAKKAAYKGVSIIENMRDLDLATSSDAVLEIYNIKDFIFNVLERYDIISSISGDCLVKVDVALNSAIDNIVSNAVVHGKAQNMHVNIENDDGLCIVEFADDGIGIPDDVKSHVFDEGFKYGETGHTGFGLFIVKKTIERYGGKVWVEDNSPQGTKFIFRLNALSMDDLR